MGAAPVQDTPSWDVSTTDQGCATINAILVRLCRFHCPVLQGEGNCIYNRGLSDEREIKERRQRTGVNLFHAIVMKEGPWARGIGQEPCPDPRPNRGPPLGIMTSPEAGFRRCWYKTSASMRGLQMGQLLTWGPWRNGSNVRTPSRVGSMLGDLHGRGLYR